MTSFEKFGVDHHSKTDKHKLVASLANTGIDEDKRETRKCKICQKNFIIRKKEHNILCSVDCHKIYMGTNEYKEYMQNILLKKYGVKSTFERLDIIKKIKQTKIDNGTILPPDQLSEWRIYTLAVRKLTNKNRKKLYENWDGYDYYDKEYIKNYLRIYHTEHNFPTVDHKLSVFYGFKNNINPETIANLNNLCITKRILNILKGKKTEDEFLSK